MAVETANILAQHYQSTYELTLELWGQRNRTFLILVAVLALGSFVTLTQPQAQPLLVDWIAESLKLQDPQRIAELRSSFPFGLLQSSLLVVVFYLMLNLYHRALYVLRNYQYLAALETEIRQHLELPKETKAFTREGSFYWDARPRLLGTVKWVYVVILGSLLMGFLVARVLDDWRTGNVGLSLVDVLLAVPILLYYVAYVRSSVTLDTRERILKREAI